MYIRDILPVNPLERTMPGPFPGMDPYLEAHWLAVHQVLVTDTWRLLNRELPQGLAACVEERVSVESGNDDRLRVGRFGPDVRVFDTGRQADDLGPIDISRPTTPPGPRHCSPTDHAYRAPPAEAPGVTESPVAALAGDG
jgi:hypothetical protein